MSTNRLITFLRSEVPEFLRNSDFYLSLDDAEDEPISIPSNCAKFSLQLNPDESKEDLRSLLNTFRFWGACRLLYRTEFVISVLTFHNKTFCCNILSEFEPELEELSVLKRILEGKTDEEALCAAISLVGFNLVKIMADHNYVFGQQCLITAAHHNEVGCLELALAKGCVWNPCVMKIAARQGHLQVMKFAHEKGLEVGEDVCFDAASTGHLSCLQYAYENGHKWPNKFVPMDNLPIALYARSVGARWVEYSCCEAAKVGNTELLMYLHQGNDYQRPISNKALLVAVWMGHTDCVRYLRSIDIPWTGCECELAAYRGHLDTLKYLCENGCRWDLLTSWVCAIHDHADCLKYLHEQGCPWDYVTPTNCSHQWTNQKQACPKCEIAAILYHTVTNGPYLGVIDKIECGGEFWYRQNVGMPHSQPRNQTIPDLVQIYKAFCKTCSFGIAAVSSYYKAPRCLLYAYKQRCAWPDNPFLLPNSEHETVRRCIYAFCRPWKARTSAKAAVCTTDQHLKYLHEHGCPWDQRTFLNALSSGDSSASTNFLHNYTTEGTCLRYALEHGCPYDAQVLRKARRNSARNNNILNSANSPVAALKVAMREKLQAATLLLGNIVQRSLCSYCVGDSYFMFGTMAAISAANVWKLYRA